MKGNKIIEALKVTPNQSLFLYIFRKRQRCLKEIGRRNIQ